MTDRPRLFLVTPHLTDSRSFAPMLEAALASADVASVLLRTRSKDERDAGALIRALGPLVQRHDAALLVEGGARFAKTVGADGVHLESLGATLDDALALLKPERIVGVGGLVSRDDAMRAGEAGADYLFFGGPGSGSDDDMILDDTAWWAEIFNVPCVAYARDPGTVIPFVRAGADFIALCEGLWTDPAGVSQALRAASAALGAVENADP